MNNEITKVESFKYKDSLFSSFEEAELFKIGDINNAIIRKIKKNEFETLNMSIEDYLLHKRKEIDMFNNFTEDFISNVKNNNSIFEIEICFKDFFSSIKYGKDMLTIIVDFEFEKLISRSIDCIKKYTSYSDEDKRKMSEEFKKIAIKMYGRK